MQKERKKREREREERSCGEERARRGVAYWHFEWLDKSRESRKRGTRMNKKNQRKEQKGSQ
jgi:hypothetical protein